MPYARRGRRRYRGRRKRGSKWGRYANTAVKALSIASRVASLVNVEFKNQDTSLPTTMSNTWSITPITLTAQGDDNNGRNGRSILAKSLFIRFAINQAPASTVPVNVRISVVFDKNPEGVIPVPSTDIYTGNSTVALRNIISDQNRFKIIKDAHFVLGTVAGGGANKVFEWYHKLHHHIKYIGTGGTSTSMGYGAMYFLVICDVATNTPTSAGTARLRYVDN